MEERDVLAESGVQQNYIEAMARDERKIAMLRQYMEEADTDELIGTYNMLLEKKRFFETESGDSFINELNQEIEIRKSMSKIHRKKELIIATVMMAVAVICIIGAVHYFRNIIHEQQVYNESQEEIDNLRITLNIAEKKEKEEKAGTHVEEVYTSININGSERTVLDKYKDLYESNHDFIGWLNIPGTQLDCPVMQADDNKYYMKHGFDRSKSELGLPFLDMRNKWEEADDNLIIYGHNLKNGNMFGSLRYYQEKDYYNEHPIIHFNTLYEKGKYEIIIVALSKVAKRNEDTFRYYEFLNAENSQDFNHAMREMRKLECYSTGKDAEWGDKLLTLSTCNDFVKNGRLFIVARKIE